METQTEEQTEQQISEETSADDSYQIDKNDIIASETTEDSTTYDAGNGVRVTEYYGQKVRFRNEAGELVDYDASLVEITNTESSLGNVLDSYVYENKTGDKKQYFPEDLTSETPILMEYGEYQISVAPVEAQNTMQVLQELSEEEMADEELMEPEVREPAQILQDSVENIYEEELVVRTMLYPSGDEAIDYQYTSLEHGVIEDIVLSEVPDNNTFTFLLKIPGLSIRKNLVNEGLTIYDEDKIIASVQAPYIEDKTGTVYDEDVIYTLDTVDEEMGVYQLSLTASEEYLGSADTQYPLTVSSPISWNDNSKISDTYVLSSMPTYNYYEAGTTSFYVGYGSNGTSRCYIAFADLEQISKKYIKSASLTLTECSNSSAGNKIYAYRVTSDWDQTAITWNNQPGCDSTAIGSLTTQGGLKTDSMGLRTLFQKYADGVYTNYGIVLKNPYETSSGHFSQFFGVRHATTSYRPKLRVEYYDRPSIPTSVTLSKDCVRPGDETTIKWSGITSNDLSYVRYRVEEYDEKENKRIAGVVEYSGTNTSIGTSHTGEANIKVGESVEEGEYKTYKVYIQGVSTRGAEGEEKGVILRADHAPPTGIIRVIASGTGEEVEVLKDTVTIVGEVDGTGSPITKNYMELYDSEGNFVRNIYTNQTMSKGRTVYTPDLENGTYTLKLHVEDSVGYTATIEKQVEVVNTLAAPVVKTAYTNCGTAEFHWDFPYAATDVCGIAYRFSEEDTWTTVENASGVSGSFTIALPDEEGEQEIRVCGIDETGAYGAETRSRCIMDHTLPVAELTSVERGLVYGTITDANLSNWEVILKQTGSDTEEIILDGRRTVENAFIGLYDMNSLISGVTYELILKVYDKAGNVQSTSQTILRNETDVPAENQPAVFGIHRPNYTAHSSSHIVFPANTTSIGLKAWPLYGNLPEGNTYWFCNGKKVSTEKTWTENYPTMTEQSYSILAVIEKDGEVYYSDNRIINKEILQMDKKRPVTLPENCVSFRVNTGNISCSVQLSIDGKTVTVSSGETIHVVKATNGQQATATSIKLLSIESGTVGGIWTVEADTVEEETFEFSEMENYHPNEAGVKDKLNYKTYLRWEGLSGECPEDISYEIYRGDEPDFATDEYHLTASNVKANYWAEMNVNYSRTFYYKIRAVKKDKQGRTIDASSFSTEISSTVVDADEYVKRMGIKEYWEYAEFDTPSGNGYIEKSRGNLVYSQVDAQIQNEKIPLSLERTYNSQSTAKTAFGVGWTHNYDIEILNICVRDSTDYKNIVLKDGNGTLFFFNRNTDGTYTSSMGKYLTLKKEEKTEEVELPDPSDSSQTSGNQENTTDDEGNKTIKVKVISSFTMKTKDNVEYRFNSSGQLIYMAESNGNFLLFDHDQNKGLLSKITTNQNLTMEFVYYTEEDYVAEEVVPDVLTVKEILLPDGSKVSYEYLCQSEEEMITDRLTKVIRTGTDKTSKLSWTLGYNDARQLTEISDACGNIYQIGYQGQKAQRVTYPNGEAIFLEYDEEKNETITYKEVKENSNTVQIPLEKNIFESSSGNSIKMVTYEAAPDHHPVTEENDTYYPSVTYEYSDDMRSKEIYQSVYQVVENGRVVEKTIMKEDTTKYSEEKNVTEEVDEDGVKTTYEYGNTAEKLKHLPTKRVEMNKEGQQITEETYTYDSDGNVIKTVDKVSGRIVETSYYKEDDIDGKYSKGDIQSETEYYNNDDSHKSSTEYQYSYDKGEKKEVMKETSGQYSVTTTTIYDVMGREKRSTDTIGTTTVTEYDPFGRLSKVTATQGDITDVVTREYNDNGSLIKEVKEDGTIYSYSYDNMNRLVSETIQKDELNKSWTTEYTYGSVNLHTGKGRQQVDHVLITTEKNPDGDILEVTYTDTLGRIIRQKQKGLYVDYVYNREGKVVTSCQLGTNPENENPVITLYLYDEGGNMSGQILNPGYDSQTKTYTVSGASLTQYMTYDSVGNMTSATDGMGVQTLYTYDAFGRITSVTLPGSSEGTDNTTRYAYDQFELKTDGTSAKTGNTQTITTDAMGRTSVITYNTEQQVIRISDCGDGAEGTNAVEQIYTYDSKGRTASVADRGGNKITYDYDGKDRITAIHYWKKSENGSADIEESRTCYTYDKSDNITKMVDYTVTGGTAVAYRYTGFSYDRLKRLTKLLELNTDKDKESDLTDAEKAQNATHYRYDIDGNLLSVTYPESDWNVGALEYTYDQNQWLTTITAVIRDENGNVNEDSDRAILRTYEYDMYGNVSKITDYRSMSDAGEKVENPEYTVCSYSYDAYLRPATMTYSEGNNPGIAKEAYTYTYDKNSRLTQETILNLYPSEVSDQQNERRSYVYDANGRLTETRVDNQIDASKSSITSYTYDAVGNRTGQTQIVGGQQETTSYSYNSLNQLVNSITTKADGTQTEQKEYQYDAAGNQIRETDSVSGTEIINTYNAAGRLANCIKKENGSVVLNQTNLYNGSGARIRKTENGTATNYFYSQGGVLYTEDGSGNGTSLNLQGITGNIIATARQEDGAEGYYYYHKDPAGSITNLRDASGESIVSYQYSDFGETAIYGDTDFYNEICYNEAVYDKSTGLYYLGARYYDPENGRFLTRDSYRGDNKNPATLHLYIYCANNPINYEDPDGHIAVSRIIGGIVGGVAGAWIGKKIAKKTKAKGWKKVAIIAGCTVAGAAVGALAGPRVAKLAKKVASYAKKRLPSRTQMKNMARSTMNKIKSGAKKTVSKTKQAISKSKSEKRLVKSGKNTLKNAIVEGTMDGSLEALSGGDFKRGFENGVIGSVIPGKSAMVTGLTGAALSVKDSILASRKGMKNIKCQTVIMNAVGSGFMQGTFALMGNATGISGEMDNFINSSSLADRVGGRVMQWMGKVNQKGVEISVQIFSRYG
ncbi:DNRLRE domain-containing protein [Dorea sp. YH-dor226]|uniref:DNRLRE domain-containing protein n=1 Tax=Dorea sp. YH-dor226 TaxID=3151119 RepID=UPI0032425807